MIKKLIKSVRQYKLTALLTPVLVALEVAAEIIIPLLIADLIDFGIDRGDINTVIKYGLFLIIAAAALCAVILWDKSKGHSFHIRLDDFNAAFKAFIKKKLHTHTDSQKRLTGINKTSYGTN